MAAHPIDRSMGDGVYYAASDYVGLWPRIVILIADTLMLGLGLWLIAFVSLNTVPDVPPIQFLCSVAFVWWYEVPLKRSRFRTLGYRLMGCKIVNLRGEPPSNFMLTFRALMWASGPFNFLFDLFWCGIDDDRQTLRDRFSSTCVVKVNAEPIGSGSVQLTRFFAGGMALMYPRVVHAKGADESVAQVRQA